MSENQKLLISQISSLKKEIAFNKITANNSLALKDVRLKKKEIARIFTKINKNSSKIKKKNK